jgi:hypothetical protein
VILKSRSANWGALILLKISLTCSHPAFACCRGKTNRQRQNNTNSSLLGANAALIKLLELLFSIKTFFTYYLITIRAVSSINNHVPAQNQVKLNEFTKNNTSMQFGRILKPKLFRDNTPVKPICQ